MRGSGRKNQPEREASAVRVSEREGVKARKAKQQPVEQKCREFERDKAENGGWRDVGNKAR